VACAVTSATGTSAGASGSPSGGHAPTAVVVAGSAGSVAQRPAGSVAQAEAVAPASDALATQVAQTPDSAPPAPPAPVSPVAPSLTVGGACGGPGAGSSSPRTTGAAAAAVVGSTAQISLELNDAAVAAPAAGSPTLTANDPATRPD
jgi:DNA polymerase-3 subunit gamma/tau